MIVWPANVQSARLFDELQNSFNIENVLWLIYMQLVKATSLLRSYVEISPCQMR